MDRPAGGPGHAGPPPVALTPPRARLGAPRQAGFTLIELVVVITLIAIVSAGVALSLRDPAEMQLQREGQRLIALLETARAESRAAGLTVRWWPRGREAGEAFRFEGLPRSIQLPTRWLGDPVAVSIERAPALLLGPEPIIPAQRLSLQLGRQRLLIASDGLAPFDIVESGATP